MSDVLHQLSTIDRLFGRYMSREWTDDQVIVTPITTQLDIYEVTTD